MRIDDAEATRRAPPSCVPWRQLTTADGVPVVLMLLTGLWLFCHPYHGIVGDAQLYAAQALSHLYPEVFRGDIFFAHGSQDNYTLFGRFYALAISAIGLNNAAFAIVTLAHALWAGASWQIAKMLPKPQRWIFLALLFTLPRSYATQLFGYGESIATARVPAEALTLAAIAFVLASRHVLATGSVFAAIFLHPLMGIWGVGFLAVFLGQHYRRHLTAAALPILALAAAVLLAATGLMPRLAATMDGEWLALVRVRNENAFLSAWSLRDFNLLAVNFCLLTAAWRLGKDATLRRLFLATLLIGTIALTLALLGGEWLHSVLLIQVQPMRAFWIVQWMAILAYATLLAPDGGDSRRIALLFATAWLAQDTIGGAIAFTTLLLTNEGTKKLPWPRLAWTMPIVAAASWLALRVANYYLDADLFHDAGKAGETAPLTALLMSLLLFLLNDGSSVFGATAAWALHALREPGAYGRWLSTWLFPAYAAFILLAGATLFTLLMARPQTFFADEAGASSLPFAGLIPPQATVYWGDNLANVWFALGRRSYHSAGQSAGALFSRPATLEMKRRTEQLTVLGGRDSVWSYRWQEPPPRSASAVRAGLLALCQDRQVDFVVHKASFPDWQVAEWSEPETKIDWRLYDCRRLAGKTTASFPLNTGRAHDGHN